MDHKFRIGQSVMPANSRQASPSTYRVVQLLPATSHEPQYRIQGVTSGIDCIVRESEIKAAEEAPR